MQQGKEYELNWIQDDYSIAKTNFEKGDNIVIVEYSPSKAPIEVKNNTCYHCKQDIAKESDRLVTYYEID